MKAIYKYLLLLPMIFGMLACTDELGLYNQSGKNQASFEDGISITLTFPEMGRSTRAMGDQTDITQLDIYLFVFDGNNLSQTIVIPRKDTQWSEGSKWSNEEMGGVTFTAKLQQTANDAIIHIVAIDDSDGQFAAQVGRVGYGIEDVVMPSLNVEYAKDAYWQRVDVGCPIKVTIPANEEAGRPEEPGTETQVQDIVFGKPIPLVRNFAKITMSTNVNTNMFDIKGFAVVNDLDRSSIAPWYSPVGDTDVYFAEYCNEVNGKNVAKDYSDLTALGYYGVSQAGANIRNSIDNIGVYSPTNLEWSADAKYIYERPYNTIAPIYILLYAEYNGAGGYYKLMLGKRDEDTGIVTDYNVIRNIQYNINIFEVKGPGLKTPEEAMAGPAWNNVSGDVTTKNLTSISDGVDMLLVNQLNFVVTKQWEKEEDKIHFRYRYLKGINKGAGFTVDNSAPQYDKPDIGLKPGDVVDTYAPAVAVKDARDNSDWMEVVITPNSPTDELKQQKFTIYSPPSKLADGSLDPDGTLGLSRTINLVLRNPWNFVRMQTFPGFITNATEWPSIDPDKDTSGNYLIGSGRGAQLTVFFELPAGLPEALFPLDCTFESDRQNIENAAGEQAVVGSGVSFFDDTSDQRIQYTRTIKWEEYADENGNSTPSSRIYCVRFVTTTDIANLFDDRYVTTIKLRNPYFNEISDQFTRQIDVSSDRDSFSATPLIWDFSDADFASLISTIGTAGVQNVNTTVNGLTIRQNAGSNQNTANYRMTTGQSGDQTYIAARRSNDSFSFTVNYPAGKAVQPVLKVFTEENVTTGNTRVNLVESHTPTSVVTVTGGDYSQNVTTKVERRYTYGVMTGATNLTITLNPGGNYNANNAVRIYRIEFYPMGEDAAN